MKSILARSRAALAGSLLLILATAAHAQQPPAAAPAATASPAAPAPAAEGVPTVEPAPDPKVIKQLETLLNQKFSRDPNDIYQSLEKSGLAEVSALNPAER